MTADDRLTDPGRPIPLAGPVAVPLDNLLRNRDDRVRSNVAAFFSALAATGSLVAGDGLDGIADDLWEYGDAMRWQPDLEDAL